MIRRWLKRIMCEAIDCEIGITLENFYNEFENIKDELESIKKFKDNDYLKKVCMLELMINEVKAIVNSTNSTILCVRHIEKRIEEAFDKQFNAFKDKYFVINNIEKSLSRIEIGLEALNKPKAKKIK